eukprot:273834-Chlamydomonas_euryale.AAC.3
MAQLAEMPWITEHAAGVPQRPVRVPAPVAASPAAAPLHIQLPPDSAASHAAGWSCPLPPQSPAPALPRPPPPGTPRGNTGGGRAAAASALREAPFPAREDANISALILNSAATYNRSATLPSQPSSPDAARASRAEVSGGASGGLDGEAASPGAPSGRGRPSRPQGSASRLKGKLLALWPGKKSASRGGGAGGVAEAAEDEPGTPPLQPIKAAAGRSGGGAVLVGPRGQLSNAGRTPGGHLQW